MDMKNGRSSSNDERPHDDYVFLHNPYVQHDKYTTSFLFPKRRKYMRSFAVERPGFWTSQERRVSWLKNPTDVESRDDIIIVSEGRQYEPERVIVKDVYKKIDKEKLKRRLRNLEKEIKEDKLDYEYYDSYNYSSSEIVSYKSYNNLHIYEVILEIDGYRILFEINGYNNEFIYFSILTNDYRDEIEFRPVKSYGYEIYDKNGRQMVMRVKMRTMGQLEEKDCDKIIEYLLKHSSLASGIEDSWENDNGGKTYQMRISKIWEVIV